MAHACGRLGKKGRRDGSGIPARRQTLLAVLRLAVGVCLLGVALAGCVRSVPAPLPDAGGAELEEVLRLAGDNRPALQEFLAGLPAGSDRRQAGEFLVAGLPVADAASLTAAELRENLDYAFAARWAMPWGRSVPFGMFLRNVLPHRAGSEVFKPWRKRFYEELAPLAARCATMAEAALRINLWCLEQAAYEATDGPALAPVDVAGRGIGRCGELSKLFVCAARSVGIPARTVLVPFWQHTESNHGWVEVWTGDGWHFLGASEPAAALDRGWFAQHLGKAPLVLATEYGGPEGASEPVYGGRRGVSFVNRTAGYAPTGTLRVEVVGQGGPVEAADVMLSVFNSGFMRPVARMRTAADGGREFIMGCGSYLAVVRSGDGGADWAVARVRPGQKTVARLDLSRKRLPEGHIELDFCPGDLPVEPQSGPGGARLAEAELTHRKAMADIARAERLRKSLDAALTALNDMAELPCDREDAVQALRRAGGNWPAVARFLAAVPPRGGEAYCAQLRGMDAKDLASATAAEMTGNVAEALAARSARPDGAVDDAMFHAHVLPWRLDDEPASGWRAGYAARFAEHAQDDPGQAALAVGRWADGLPSASGGYSIHEMTPEQILRSGHVAQDSERFVAAGAALRALGIPVDARERRYHDGKSWLAVPVGRTAEPAGTAAAQVVIPLRALVPGYDPRADGDPFPALFREFAVTRLDPRGIFLPENADPVPGGSRPQTITLDRGEYYLTIGERDVSGRVTVEIRPFRAGEFATP